MARSLRWSILTLGGVATGLILVFAVIAWQANDCSDDPAMLLNVATDGTVTLKTYRGEVKGRLANVHWREDPQYLESAKSFIDSARRDTVQWTSRSDGIRIWYQTTYGQASLNEQLGQLSDITQK